ncbi:fap1 adhesin [Amia ocellicauda]|uniref:fap1 adhesin n=1 Tax=Amia ocellicauda TaxID=2972642 RepID=UPI0034644E46
MTLRKAKKQNAVSQPKTLGGHSNLDSPLGVKLFVPEGVRGTYYTTGLSQRRHQERPEFDLLDPHCHLLDNEYNSLQDTHLKGFYKNKARLRNVTMHGLLTKEKKVVCSLKEFNEYTDYLKTIKMNWEKSNRQQQKEHVKQFLILQEQKIIPEDVAVTDMKEWLLEQGWSTFWQQGEARRLRCQQSRPRADQPLSRAEQADKMKERQMLQELEVEVRTELRLERHWKKTSVKPGMLKKLREAARRIARNRKVSPAAEEDMQIANSEHQPTPQAQLSDLVNAVHRVYAVEQQQMRQRVTVEELDTIAECVVESVVPEVNTTVLPAMLDREQESEGERVSLTSTECLSNDSLTPHNSASSSSSKECLNEYSTSSQSFLCPPDQLSPTVHDDTVECESSPLPDQQGVSVGSQASSRSAEFPCAQESRPEAVLSDCLILQEVEMETGSCPASALDIIPCEEEAACMDNSGCPGSLSPLSLGHTLVDPICGIVARAADTLLPPPVPSDPRVSAQTPPCHKASSEAILSGTEDIGQIVQGFQSERDAVGESEGTAGFTVQQITVEELDTIAESVVESVVPEVNTAVLSTMLDREQESEGERESLTYTDSFSSGSCNELNRLSSSSSVDSHTSSRSAESSCAQEGRLEAVLSDCSVDIPAKKMDTPWLKQMPEPQADGIQAPLSSAAAGRASLPPDNINTEVRHQPQHPSASSALSSASCSSSSSGVSSVASSLVEDMITELLHRLSTERSAVSRMAEDLVQSVLQNLSENWELSIALEQQGTGREGLRSHSARVRAAVSSAHQQLVQHSGSPDALRRALSCGSEDLRVDITSTVVEQLNVAFLGSGRSQSSQRVTSPVARELQSSSETTLRRASVPVELVRPSSSLPPQSPSVMPSDTEEDEEQLPASLAVTPTAELPTQPGAAGQAGQEEPEDLTAGTTEVPGKHKPSTKERIRLFCCRISKSLSQLRIVRVTPEPPRPKSI